MSVIAFASAKGSPGVSQAVAALAHLWAGEVVVADLDPAGGDLVLVQRDSEGDPLSTEVGLVSLGAALRNGSAADLADHLQTSGDGVPVLAGVSTPSQVHALGPVWPHVAGTLASWNGDVLADCGRFVLGSPVQSVIDGSAGLVLLARNDLASLAHLRERLQELRTPLSIGRMGGTPVGVALVGNPGDQRSVSDMERLFASADLHVEGLGMIAHDARAAQTWWSMSPRARQRSVFHRSLVDVGTRIREMVSRPRVGADGGR